MSIDFESAVQAGYTPSPNFEMLDSVADFKCLVEPALADIHNHTKPLSFRFLKHKSGHAVFQYRHKTSDKKWLPEGDGIRLLTVSN